MYGALRGLALVAVLYIAYVKVVPQAQGADGGSVIEGLAQPDQLPAISPDSPIADAYSVKLVRPVAEYVWARIPKTMPAFLQQRAEELTGNCDRQ